MEAAIDRMFHFETPNFAFCKKPVILYVTGYIMPDTSQTQFDETKAAEHVLAASQRLHRLCLGLAKNGHGYEIIIRGKGDSPLTVSYTVFMGAVM